jgi:hypothetical protein
MTTETVNLEATRRWRETDPELRLKNETGTWFVFSVQFECDGSTWGVDLWAHDHADAERRLEALKGSGRILGQKMSSVPA